MTRHSNGITGMCRSWINLINLDTRNLTWCGDARSYLDQLRRKRRDRKYITQYGNQAKKSGEIFSFQICGAYVYLDIEKDWLCEKEHHWFNETCWLRNIKYRRLRLPQFLLQCIRRFECYTADIFSLQDEKRMKKQRRRGRKDPELHYVSSMRHKQNAGEDWEKIMEWSLPFLFSSKDATSINWRYDVMPG